MFYLDSYVDKGKAELWKGDKLQHTYYSRIYHAFVLSV